MDVSTNIDFITFLYTPDLDTTELFYSQIMNLEMILDQGKCKIFQINPCAFIGFCNTENLNRTDDNIIITFVLNNVDEWYKKFCMHNIEIVKHPQLNQEFQIYHFFARDPNGYLLEIQRFLNDNWKAK